MTLEPYRWPDNPRDHSSNLDPGWDEIWPKVSDNDETLTEVQDLLDSQQDTLQTQQDQLDSDLYKLWNEGTNDYNSCDPSIPDGLGVTLGGFASGAQHFEYHDYDNTSFPISFVSNSTGWETNNIKTGSYYGQYGRLYYSGNWKLYIKLTNPDTGEYIEATWENNNSVECDPRGAYYISDVYVSDGTADQDAFGAITVGFF